MADYSQQLGVLRSTSCVGLVEAVMNTFGNIIAAKEKEGEARGKKEILLQFLAEFWRDDEAARFAQQLDSADRSQIPTIADLMRDQAAGRLPRLRANGRTDPRK